MGDTVVREGATVNYSIIDTEVEIGEGAIVGADKAEAAGIAVLGRGVKVEAGASVEAGAMVSAE